MSAANKMIKDIHKYSNHILFIMLEIALIGFVQFSCEQKENHEKIMEEQLISKPETTNDLLLIVDFIPLGSKYEFVRGIFPDISELQDRGYDFYCTSKTYLFESQATIEFVFDRSKELYRIGIRLTLNCSEADSLYAYLQTYYSNKFGEYGESHEKDPSSSGYPVYHGTYWYADIYDITLGYGEYESYCLLGWGFQYKRNSS